MNKYKQLMNAIYKLDGSCAQYGVGGFLRAETLLVDFYGKSLYGNVLYGHVLFDMKGVLSGFSFDFGCCCATIAALVMYSCGIR